MRHCSGPRLAIRRNRGLEPHWPPGFRSKPRPGGGFAMTDVETRFEAVRSAGRKLEVGDAKVVNRSGPPGRNGEAGGLTRTLFSMGRRPARESAADRSDYLLKCQAVIAEVSIPRAETVNFPREGEHSAYLTRKAELVTVGRPPRNANPPPAAQAARNLYDRPRSKRGLFANLIDFLR
jgi:hypothetical protein